MEIHVMIVLPDGFLEKLGIDDETLVESYVGVTAFTSIYMQIALTKSCFCVATSPVAMKTALAVLLRDGNMKMSSLKWDCFVVGRERYV